jgi:glycosyltransferase involved in cell wall biosynthesis
LVYNFHDKLFVVSWDKNNLTPHIPNFIDKIKYIKRSKCNYNYLVSEINSFQPDLILVSGRMDSLYLKVLLVYKGEIPIVSGFDSQWENNIKSYLKISLRKRLFHKYFDYIWVPGYRQYYFARMLGFKNSQILKSLYSGNFDLFCKRIQPSFKDTSESIYILFVGRVELIKGVDVLLLAFNYLIKKYPNIKLVIAGNGSLLDSIDSPSIIKLGFLNQVELLNWINNKDIIFCLPSRNEPWGVVVHEAAAAALPIVVSSYVGSLDDFVINNYNGKVLDKLTLNSLVDSLEMLINLSFNERQDMGLRSRNLAAKITPKISAASLRQVLKF